MLYNELSDEELAELLKKGDHKAFNVIFDRFYGLLFVHACKLLKDHDEAKDVVQELFEKLWNQRETISFERSLSAYLYSSVRNRIINRISHYAVEHKYIDSLKSFIVHDNYFADYRVREGEMRKMIEREISALPAKMKEVFELSRRDYLTYKQIAVKLQISEQTVRMHVKKALRILKPKLSIIAYLFLYFNI
ncbi:RNA polymerase sigma-70 factor [Pedobacter nyackensis]|uniref:RNA polymerase sigma factor n=1 Tax=Pedobacter nyackensis TaxID=475255 RepID=UPI0029304392|nr:RNA polymerase sigma-70 factor [Pedobacter nyackensis]